MSTQIQWNLIIDIQPPLFPPSFTVKLGTFEVHPPTGVPYMHARSIKFPQLRHLEWKDHHRLNQNVSPGKTNQDSACRSVLICRPWPGFRHGRWAAWKLPCSPTIYPFSRNRLRLITQESKNNQKTSIGSQTISHQAINIDKVKRSSSACCGC